MDRDNRSGGARYPEWAVLLDLGQAPTPEGLKVLVELPIPVPAFITTYPPPKHRGGRTLHQIFGVLGDFAFRRPLTPESADTLKRHFRVVPVMPDGYQPVNASARLHGHFRRIASHGGVWLLLLEPDVLSGQLTGRPADVI